MKTRAVRWLSLAGALFVTGLGVWCLFNGTSKYPAAPANPELPVRPSTQPSPVIDSTAATAKNPSFRHALQRTGEDAFTREILEATKPDDAGDAAWQTSAKMLLAEQDKERQAILTQVASETVEESFKKLASTEPSAIFYSYMDAISTMDIDGHHSYGIQRSLLHEPRVAKVLAAARAAAPGDREKYLGIILRDLEHYVDGLEAQTDGRPFAPDTRNPFSRDSYPILLAELDERGQSLSLLARWYESLGRSAAAQRVSDVESGRLDSSHLEHPTYSTGQFVIAGAVAVIAQVQPVITTRTGRYDDGERHPFEPHRRFALTGDVLSLQGYLMLPALFGRDADAVMRNVFNLSQNEETE